MPKRAGGLAVSYANDSFAGEGGDSDLEAQPTARAKSGSSRAAPKSKALASAAPKQNNNGTNDGAATASSNKTTASKKSASARTPLKEIANTQGASDTEALDELDKAGDGFSRGGDKQTANSKGRPAKGKSSAKRASLEAVDEIKETQDIAVQSKLARSQTAANKRMKVSRKDAVPDTQLETMDIDEEPHDDPIEDAAPRVPIRSSKRTSPASRARHGSVPRPRAGSASDTERGTTEPALRRKLADVTKKFETLEFKYRDLKDVELQGETNFDDLKKQADTKTKAANDLIASLRSELATQKSLAAEATKLQSQLAARTKENATLISDKKNLETSLHDAQNENKTLMAKLSATRAGSAPDGTSKAPGSTAQNQPRTFAPGSAEAAKEMQKRQLKEDLYSDLTGLLLRDVKRREEEGEDVYDCIQTGRNGTLHFHLSIANPAPTSYEDAEFQYTPLLDASRDRELLEILPDYLTEEICFPRSNAAKFYARVVDCMTKKVELVE